MSKDSYRQIMKSATIVGGSQVLNILINIIKTKIVALLLGPTGIGIIGVLQTVIDLLRNATGFGINFSCVKDIAEATSTEDIQLISRKIAILQRWALATGLLGMFLCVVFSIPLSNYSFGNSSYAYQIAILSSILLITSISSSQIAILQGLRKITTMAKATLYGSIIATMISIPIYWILHIKGIIVVLLLSALISNLISWIYTRKYIRYYKYRSNISFKTSFFEGVGMAKLGFYIVVNGFIASAALYIIRGIILNNESILYVGYFQSVWTISTIYVNILLNAMLADYFPRLSIASTDNIASNKLINEQLEITMLIGTPMLIGLMILSPLIIKILYTSSFTPAVPILQWHMLSSFLIFVSWPLGVLFLAKNKGWYCVAGETFRQCLYIIIVYYGWRYYKFNILGIGYFISAIIGLAYTIPSIKHIIFFKFSSINIIYIAVGGISMLFCFILILFFSCVFVYIICFTLLFIITYIYTKRLNKIVGVLELLKSKFNFIK